MFKNVRLKKLLKSTVFSGLGIVNKLIPKNDGIILLYSPNREIGGNLKAVRDYLLKNKYYNKYHIVCAVPNMKYADNIPNVRYITKIRAFLLFLKTGHVFYTTGQIPIKPAGRQIAVHLDHGTAAIKTIGALSKINNGYEFYFTYYLAPSPIYKPIIAKEFLCKEENVVVCGEACTDIMYGDYVKYDLGNYDKIILWAPTFRQSDFYGYNDSSEELLPMFTEDDYDDLNNELKKYNFRLIVKLHAGQNLSNYRKLKYSHLMIYSDADFKETEMELYSLLPQIDYLLADYSSVFLEYLLLDRPIGFVVPDLEEYRQKRGFIFDKPLDYMPGNIIKCKEELYACFKEWHRGIDTFAEQRKIVRDKIHTYQDGNNAKRAVEIAGLHL